MSVISRIVASGGWKGTQVERVKVRAWVALFLAIGFGSVSVVGADSLWFYAWVPGGLALLASVVLFLREKPREVEWPVPWPPGKAPHDLRKLYGASGSKDKSRPAPNDDPSGRINP